MDVKANAENRVDPVCKKQIPRTHDAPQSRHKGRFYRFCSPGCKREFDADPNRYATEPEKAGAKGFWARYLKRIQKSTGGKPPSCCQ